MLIVKYGASRNGNDRVAQSPQTTLFVSASKELLSAEAESGDMSENPISSNKYYANQHAEKIFDMTTTQNWRTSTRTEIS